MIDYKHIENLIERFFEGKTSNEEEKELYSFFSGSDIPEDLKLYIPVFQFFETKIEEEFKIIQKPVLTPKKTKSNIKQWSMWVGIAASLLLTVTISNKIIKNNHSFDSYEGSYIIRNGKVITDLDVIRPELEATEAAVSKQQKTMDKMITRISQGNGYEQVKEEIEDQYCELINSFPDEFTRNKVKEILNVECN